MLVSGNTVYGQRGTGDAGIFLDYGAQAAQNVVFGNYRGIKAGYGSGTVSNNRVYNNDNERDLTPVVRQRIGQHGLCQCRGHQR